MSNMRLPRGLAVALFVVATAFVATSAHAVDDIRIDEFNITCVNGFPNAAFVELTAAGPDQVYDNTIKLRFLNSNGTTRYEMPIGVSALAGQSWPQGRRWLIGYTNFFGTTQVVPDAEMTNVPATSGAVLLVRGTGASATVLDRVDYVNNGAIPAPTLGRSLQRQSDLSWLIKSAPDPTTAGGITAAAANCYLASNLSARVSEMGLMCTNGQTTGQFIELKSISGSATRDAGMRLRTYDRNGALLAELTNLFGAASGQAWLNGTEWLIAPSTLKGPAGEAPDLTLPTPLDTVGGRILFVRREPNGSETVLSDFTYGTPALPRPGYGRSLVYSTSYIESVLPTPKGSNAATYSDPMCERPLPSSAYLSEMQVLCSNGTTVAQFIELGVLNSGEQLWPELTLEILDHDGQRVGLLLDPFGSSRTAPWIPSRRWLIATPGYRDPLLHDPDMMLSLELDPHGGRIILRDMAAPAEQQVRSDLTYGAGGVPAPAAGHSLEWDGAQFVERSTPGPTGIAGQPFSNPNCGRGEMALTVREFQLRCVNGATNGQFIELVVPSTGEKFDARLSIDIRDHDGVLLQRLTQPFGARTGQFWVPGRAWLIGTNAFRTASSLLPDAILPATLDTLGGRLDFVYSAPTGEFIGGQFVYGPGGAALPSFGKSMTLSGSVYAETTPSPIGYNELAYSVDAECKRPFETRATIDEIQLVCFDGSLPGQFIELKALENDVTFDARHRVRVYDRDNALLGELGVAPALWGTPWGKDLAFLLANPIWTSNRAPDVQLAFTLDPLAGRIELLGPYGATNSKLLSSFSYGHPGELAVIPGTSFQRQPDESFAIDTTPQPVGTNGQAFSAGRCSAPGLAPIGISEFGTRCFNGSDASFIELHAAGQAYHDNDIVLIVRDHLGVELGRLSNMWASYVGTAWPTNRFWLIGTPAFSASNGLTVGTVLPFALDPVGGSIVMRQPVQGVLTTVDSVSYGPGFEAPAPPPGRSAVRASWHGAFTVGYPTPTYIQVTGTSFDCVDPTQWGIQIQEFATSCPDSPTPGQFIELGVSGAGYRYFSSIRIRAYDAAGVLRGESTQPFAGYQDAPWSTGVTVLMGRVSSIACSNTFDTALPGVLDPTGGRLEIVAVQGTLETQLQSIAYGPGTPLPAPGEGQSLVRAANGQYVISTKPTPQNRAGVAVWIPACGTTPPSLRIESFALGCASGHDVGQFVELRSTGEFIIPADLFLQIRNPNNQVSTVPLAASRAGQTWPAGTSYLFTSKLWPTHLGRCADAEMGTLPTTGGSIRIVRRFGANCEEILQQVTYGPAGEIALPPMGAGIARDESGAWVQDPWPAPACFNGDTTWLVPCLSADPKQTVVVQEFALRDANGGVGNQFIELSSSENGQMWDRRLGLRTYNGNGALIQTITPLEFQLFMGLWRPGVPRTVTLTNSLLTSAATERRLLPLDVNAGRIEVMYQPSDGSPMVVIRSVDYGPGRAVAAPAPGYSAQRMPDGSYYTTARPTPADLLGALSMATYPIAGCGLATLMSSTGENEPVGTPTFDRLQTIAPTRSTYDKSRGTVSSSAGPGMTAATNTTDRFLLEAPVGTALPVTVRMRAATQFVCDTSGCARGSVQLKLTVGAVASSQTQNSTTSTTIDIPVTFNAGLPIMIEQEVVAYQSTGPGFTRRVFADAQLEFVGVPAGMKITSCSGYLQDQPVPALLSLAEAVASADQARLVWRVDQSAAFEARVQRREEGSEWLDIGTVRVDGAGQLEFTDSSVLPLHRYAYRLTWSDPERGTISAGEAWLDIPRALAFALHGARPNPSRGALTVAFQLATEGEVRIELLDIAGRRVLEHRVDRMAPGDHLISLARAGSVAPGLYALRLKQGERQATTRVIVTR